MKDNVPTKMQIALIEKLCKKLGVEPRELKTKNEADLEIKRLHREDGVKHPWRMNLF